MAKTIARDHGQKRTQILKSATKVFANEGYDRASMSLLAKECGISKANIYHYYDSKDAILQDLLESYLSALRDRVCGLDLQGQPPEERLYLTLREILLAYQGADNEHRVQIAGLSRLPLEVQKDLRQYQRELTECVSVILAEIAPGPLGQDKVRLRATVMSVFGMLNWYYMWKPNAGTAAREGYARLVADLTLNGVRGL